MPVNVDDVIVLFCCLSKVKGMKAAVSHSGSGLLMAGTSALIGGLLGGPPGFVVGGAFGGILGALRPSGQFKPVPQILLKLPPSQQRKLYGEAMVILRRFNLVYAVDLISFVMENFSLQEELTAVLIKFLSRELSAKIQYGE